MVIGYQEGSFGFDHQHYIKLGELNAIFVDLSIIALFGHFLLLLAFAYGFQFCVFMDFDYFVYMYSILSFFLKNYYLFLWFFFTCLFFKMREKRCVGWVQGELGRIWEKFGKGKSEYIVQIFSIKSK